ncbi:ATP-binding protein [Fibrella aquatica]|uniref:ATP-binding protein n=1 Tax=Fibrella aquatica TaxID=3242487 RepID=UPI0035200D3B
MTAPPRPHSGHQVDEQVARRLTRFYVLALSVLALLAVSGIVLVRRTLNEHYDDGRVLNVAGRQRMLSQRLTKLALLHSLNVRASDQTPADSLLRTWTESHRQLRNGTLLMEKAYTVPKSPILDSMFALIDPVFQRMHNGLTHVMQPGKPSDKQQAALQVVLANEPAYLKQMNAIVFQFDAESVARVRSLERTEWFLGLATLLTLLLEGLFIFRPVVNYTKLIIRQLSRSEENLQATNNTLTVANQTLTDTRQQLVQAIQDKHRLQRAEDTVRSAALLEGQEEERRRFARELHDGIGQMLTGLKLQAGTLKKASFTDEKHRRRAENLCELVGDIIQTTRQISHNLMPSVLSDFGLGAALQLLADQTAYSTGLIIQCSIPDPTLTQPPKRLNPAVEIGLYRIAQEAINNAVKHASAKHIWLTLQEDDEVVAISIDDDGHGFTPPFIDNGLTLAVNPTLTGRNGIDTMRTRARLLNGTLTIQSAPGKGTSIITTIHRTNNLLT